MASVTAPRKAAPTSVRTIATGDVAVDGRAGDDESDEPDGRGHQIEDGKELRAFPTTTTPRPFARCPSWPRRAPCAVVLGPLPRHAGGLARHRDHEGGERRHRLASDAITAPDVVPATPRRSAGAGATAIPRISHP